MKLHIAQFLINNTTNSPKIIVLCTFNQRIFFRHLQKAYSADRTVGSSSETLLKRQNLTCSGTARCFLTASWYWQIGGMIHIL